MDKKNDIKEPTIDLNPDQSIPKEQSMVEEESIKGSKDGGTLVDTSVESKAVEPKSQPINPPKTTKLKPKQLPKISEDVSTDVSTDVVPKRDKQKELDDWVNKTETEYEEYLQGLKKPKYWESTTKTPREPSEDDFEEYDEWNDNELNFIRSLMPEVSEASSWRDEKELQKEFQSLVNNPEDVIYGRTALGENIRSRLVDKVARSADSKLGWCKEYMNNLASVRRLYSIAINSDNPETRKNAIRKINQIEESTNERLEKMSDDDKIRLKNYMLLVEYLPVYGDLKNYPDDMEIWITPRETNHPIVTKSPRDGAYHTTIGDFKGDIYRLASGRSTGNVFLPSGITMTRRKPKDTDLYAIDFDQFFNPYRYIRMDKEKQNQLAKDGLTRYFDMTQPDYTPITESMDRNTYMLIEAIKSNKELTEKQKQAEIERVKKEADERLRKEQNRRQKAEQDAQRAEKELQEEYEIQDTMRRNAADKAQDEAYRQAEKQQAKDATSMNPDVINDMAKMDYNKELEGVKKNMRVVENALLVANNNVTEAGLRRLLSGLEKYAQNLELMRSVGGTGDPNIIADALRDLGGIIQKNPAVRTVLKAAEWAPYIGLVISAYDVGKDFYDKWQDKENFYSDLHNRERFKTYFDKAFEAYPNAKKYYLENMDSPQDMKALWKLQLKDNVPKYQEQTQTSSYVYPNRENISSILSGMRKTDMNIVRRAAEGYGEKYTKESTRTQVNPYKSSKNDILDMLGLTNLKNVQDKEIQMLRKNPWMLPFMQSFHSTSSPEFRGEVYKRLLKQWKTAFRDFSE